MGLLTFCSTPVPTQCAGGCPVSPLALPRRLTDGFIVSAAVGSSGAPAFASAAPGVAVSAGAAEPYSAAAAAAVGPGADAKQHRSPMRKRIVNLTVAAGTLWEPSGASGPRSATASPEPADSKQQEREPAVNPGGSSGSTPGAAGPPVAAPAGPTAAAAGMQSVRVLSAMHHLMSSNPALPVGLRSQLRASAPCSPSAGPIEH